MPGYVLSRGTNLSQAHEEKLDMLVQEIRPEIPLYVTTMKHSNVNSHHASLVSSAFFLIKYIGHNPCILHNIIVLPIYKRNKMQ